jgi:hypothetical protein
MVNFIWDTEICYLYFAFEKMTPYKYMKTGSEKG